MQELATEQRRQLFTQSTVVPEPQEPPSSKCRGELLEAWGNGEFFQDGLTGPARCAKAQAGRPAQGGRGKS